MRDPDATVRRAGSPPVDPDATVLRPQSPGLARAGRPAAKADHADTEFPATTVFDPDASDERDPTTIVTPRQRARPDPTTVVVAPPTAALDATLADAELPTVHQGERTLQRGTAPGPLPRHSLALPKGLRLLEYRIERVLGQGGFGITYLATDANLDAKVAIKEYLPEEIAFRANDRSVSPNASQHRDRYHQGLENFLTEARTLASFRHPNIVRVARFFEAHSTAYMVLEYERGKSFKKWWLAQRHQDERLLVERLQPLLDGLSAVHAAGYLHRDIKPDNIQVRSEDGRFVLLDFGSAGQTVALADQDAVVVTPGYAPIEQYGMGEQGAWTDIYALGATLYWAVAGKKPPDAEARAAGTPMAAAAELGRGRFGAAFLAGIDWALQSDPAARPRSIDAWCDRLLADHVSNGGLKQALQRGDSLFDGVVGETPQRRWRARLRLSWRRLRTPSAWPLAAKLALVMAGSAMLPLFAVSLFDQQQARQALLDGELRRTELVAHGTAARLTQWLADGMRAARVLAADAELAPWLAGTGATTAEPWRQRLAALVRAHPDLVAAQLLDAGGAVRAATDVARPPAGGITVSEPVRDAAGRPQGSVRLQLREAALGGILDGVRHDAELTPFLLDREGRLLHHPRQELLRQVLDEPVLAPAMRAARHSGALAYHSKLSGLDEIAGFAPVAASAWVVGVSTLRGAAERPLHPMRAHLPWTLALVGLVFTGVALRLARSVVRPVRSLTRGAYALKSGDFERAYVDVKARDEVGQLVRTFNVTVDVLRQRERERATRRRS